MVFKIIALALMGVFYICYFAKMLVRRKREFLLTDLERIKREF